MDNELFSSGGVHELACAIVAQAINDYRTAVRSNNKYKMQELEDFFNSQWCYELCGYEGAVFVEGVKKSEAEKKHRRNEGKGVKRIYIKAN